MPLKIRISKLKTSFAVRRPWLPLLLGVILFSCAKKEDTTSSSCQSVNLSSASWAPSVSGAGDSNHDSGVTITRETYTASGVRVVGAAQGLNSTYEATITIPMTTDLGDNGSISLVAEATGFPSGLSGNAYPILVSLSDGTNELVNVAKAGTGGDCYASGFYVYSSGWSANTSCTVNSPSAYVDRNQWIQHQVPGAGYASVNTFPTCNWSSGTPTCAFNSTFFSSGKLRTGASLNYTAKYILMADRYTTISGTYTAGLEVTVVKKQDTTAPGSSGNGAVDLNIIMVGSKNISDGNTAKGQQNMSALLTHMQDHYNQSGMGIKLGQVSVYEWNCDTYTYPVTSGSGIFVDDVFKAGSSQVSSATEGKAVNLFFVSSIDSGGVLGIAGSIRGPMVNGLGSSGVAVATANKLATYNSACSGSGTCAISQQEADFVDMGATISHEVGHYLGLNHLNEKDGTREDPVPDTPTCGVQVISGQSYVTHTSCLAGSACSTACSSYNTSSGVFCPTASQCQFNHVMWWTTKYFNETTDTGDGNLFSADSDRIVNYNPLVK